MSTPGIHSNDTSDRSRCTARLSRTRVLSDWNRPTNSGIPVRHSDCQLPSSKGPVGRSPVSNVEGRQSSSRSSPG